MVRALLLIAICGCGGRVGIADDLDASAARDSGAIGPADADDEVGGELEAAVDSTTADAPLIDAAPSKCRSHPNGAPISTGPAPDYRLGDPIRFEMKGHDIVSMAVGDVTGDGRADVVGADWDKLSVAVQGVSALKAPVLTEYPFNNPASVTLADLDGDGVYEVVVALRTGLRIMQADATGALTKLRDVDGPSLARLRAVDVDGDGLVDIAGVQLDTSGFYRRLVVYRGAGKGELGAIETTTLPDEVRDYSIVDLDRDGITDLLYVPNKEPATLQRWRRSSASWVAVTSYSLPGAERPAFEVGDMNGDLRNDLVVADSRYSRGAVLVLQGTPEDKFTPPVTVADNYYGSGPIRLGDLNGDGRLDIAVVHSGAFELGVLLANDKGLGKETISKFPTAASVLSGLAVGDVTCDGCPDVLGTDVWGLVLFPGVGCAKAP